MRQAHKGITYHLFHEAVFTQTTNYGYKVDKCCCLLEPRPCGKCSPELVTKKDEVVCEVKTIVVMDSTLFG